jgi:hypothetical protein
MPKFIAGEPYETYVRSLLRRLIASIGLADLLRLIASVSWQLATDPANFPDDGPQWRAACELSTALNEVADRFEAGQLGQAVEADPAQDVV